MSGRTGLWCAVVGLVWGLSGCSIQKLAVDELVPVLVRTKDSFNRETQAQYGREAGPALIAFLGGLVETSPENPDLRLLEAELHASFAFGFLEREDPAWATDFYRKAQAAALVALADECEDLAEELPTLEVGSVNTRLEDAVDEDAVPALFWWAFARGSEINVNRSDTKLVAELPRVKEVMRWVVSKDEDYFYGGPHLFLAIAGLTLGEQLGGDPAASLAHFEAVDRLSGGKHLMGRVLRAQFWAPTLASTPPGSSLDEVLAAQRAAWDAFYEPLVAVLEAPADLWPAQNLSNALAKQRALALLEDPESYNIIVPDDAENAYAPAGGGGGWGGDDEGDDWGDDDGWGD